MITCPNCGTANEPNNRFCMECGADLSSLASSGRTAPADQPAPPAEGSRSPTSSSPFAASDVRPPERWQNRPKQATELPPTDPGWKMSDPGPLPDPKRRRTWLWIVIGFIAAILLCCCLFFVYINTIGEDWWNDIETRIAEEQTEVAD